MNRAARRRTGVRHIVRRTAAAGAAAALALSPLPATATASATPVAAWDPWGYGYSDPYGGYSDPYGGWTDPGLQSAAQPGTQVSGAPGVVLVDTVLASGQAAGTGMVIDSSGLVLTNYHVVEGSTSIRVTVADTGRTYPATVVGHDADTDVALLRLAGATGLETVTFDTDRVSVGETVRAVGNAGGEDTLYAVSGTLTDTSDTIQVSDETGLSSTRTLRDLLATDADVAAGDSGGPLLDADGEVVGMTTAASTGAVVDGYAIPIARAVAVVRQIEAGAESGSVRVGPKAALGVTVATATADQSGWSGGGYATPYESSVGSGATITSVAEDSAAQRAGLQAGDTVTAVGSATVSGAADLAEAIGGHDPGDQVAVTWTGSAGERHTAVVILGTSSVN